MSLTALARFWCKSDASRVRKWWGYGSFETAALIADLVDNGDDDPQSNLSQIAIGLGYEHKFSVVPTTTTLKVGYEAHQWTGIEDSSDGVFGFDGLVVGAAVSF